MACRFALWALSALFVLSCSQESPSPTAPPAAAAAEEAAAWQTVEINGALYRRVAAKPTTTQETVLITITIPVETSGDGTLIFSDTVLIGDRVYTADCATTGGGSNPPTTGSDDVGNTQATATSLTVLYPPAGSDDIAYWESPQYRISSSSDVDYFRLRVTKTVFLAVGSLGSIDTKGTLYNASGGVLDRNDDGFSDTDPNNRNFFLFARVTAGTYYVKVEGYNQATGPYRLGISTLNVSNAAGKPVAAGYEQKMKKAYRP